MASEKTMSSVSVCYVEGTSKAKHSGSDRQQEASLLAMRMSLGFRVRLRYPRSI